MDPFLDLAFRLVLLLVTSSSKEPNAHGYGVGG